jgi:hypothetical protein
MLVVNDLKLPQGLPRIVHSCPEYRTLTGKWLSKLLLEPIVMHRFCKFRVESRERISRKTITSPHEETSWRLDKCYRSFHFVQSFGLFATRRDSVFPFYVAREFTTIERRDQLVERVPDATNRQCAQLRASVLV